MPSRCQGCPRVGLVEYVAVPIIHRVMDGVAVDGVRRRNAQALVLKDRAES